MQLKRFLMSVLVVVVLLSLTVFSASAADTDAMSISVAPVEGATVDDTDAMVATTGETIILDVTIDSNPGVTYLDLALEYDDTALELVKAEYTGPFAIDGEIDIATPGSIGIRADYYTGNAENVTDESVNVLRLTFKVLVHGTTEITFDPNYTFPYDADLNDVAFTANDATIVAHPKDAITVDEHSATCTENGYTTYTCTTCGESYTIPGAEATGSHTEVPYPAEAPTCDEPGKTAGVWCSVCETWLVEQEEVAATGHNYVSVERVEPNCGTPGREAGIMCTVCGDIKEGCDPIEAGGEHAPYDYIAAIDATCNELGFTAWVKCSVCQADISLPEAIAPLGHKFGEGEVTEATHSAFGYTTYTCLNECGFSYVSDYVPTLDHTFDEGVKTEPTDTELGYTTYTCDCGFSYKTDFVPSTSHNHTFDEGKKTEATHFALGYTTYTCECGYSYKTDFVPVTAHTFVKGETTAPTHTTLGYTAYACECGLSYNADYVPALDHTFVKGETTAPTCTDIGYTTYACACGLSYKADFVPATHKYVKTVVEATCKNAGYTRYACECGESYVTDYVDALAHKFDNGTKTDATCTDMGYTTYTCSCGYSYKDNYVAPSHNYTEKITPPTCTTAGYTTYTCTCGNSYVTDYVEATGHTYTEVTTGATCTTMGYTTYTCTTCGDVKIGAYVDAKGHTYTGVTTEATCTTMGYTTYTCACGHSYIGAYVDAHGHTYEYDVPALDKNGEPMLDDNGEAVMVPYVPAVTAPTCTTMGYTTYKCGDCDYSYVGDYKDATGHTYTATVTEATCTTIGYTTYTCACGDTYKADITDLKAHTVVEDAAVEPTYSAEGKTAGSHCSVCNTIIDEQEIVPAKSLAWLWITLGFVVVVAGLAVAYVFIFKKDGAEKADDKKADDKKAGK